MIKFFNFLLLFLLLSCDSAILPVEGQVESMSAIDKSALDVSVFDEVSMLPSMNMGDGISLSDYGGMGDAIQRNDFSIAGDKLTANGSVFTKNDIGKIFSVAGAGAENEHLVGRIIGFVNTSTVLTDVKASYDVNSKLGSYGTDNMIPIQKAIDAAISKNIPLFIPAGVYLIGDRNANTGKASVEVKMNKPKQNLVIVGAGKEQTIIRELDGKTQRYGRYTKMFYHYLKDSPDVGTIYLSSFAFDKNGRSLTKSPKTHYEWEQAHCWGWSMGTEENSPDKIDAIYLKNIEIIDKIGAGINYSSGPTKVGDVIINNITEKEFHGSDKSGIEYGERGDLEISCFSEDVNITNSTLRYVQIEPVTKFSADKDHPRLCKISDSNIYNLQYTEGDNKNPMYSRLEVKNITSENFLCRSISFLVEDSDIKIPDLINSVDGKIRNTKIRLPYNAQKNTITPVNCSHLRTLDKINNNVVFDNCTFVIEDSNPSIHPKGVALRAGGKVSELNKNKITIENCTFDSRLESSIDAYGNGTWIIRNNVVAGTKQAISVGGYKNFVSNVTMVNNDYSNLSTSIPKVKINNNNTLWELNLGKALLNDTTFYSKKGSLGSIKSQIKYNQ